MAGADVRAARPLILDMDGVLYVGEVAQPGLAELAQQLAHRAFACVTNNSFLSAEQCSERLARMGLSVDPDRIVTAATAMRDHLRATLPSGSRVFVIGAPVLHEAVRSAGMEEAARDVAAVAVGVDPGLGYAELARAVQLLQGGADLVAANDEPCVLTPEGCAPGTGAIVALLTRCVPVVPAFVGKPAAAMFDSALRLLGAAGPETVVIGDSPRTDIAGGRAIGATTVLITNGPDRSGGTPEEQPDVTVAGLAPLARLLETGEL